MTKSISAHSALFENHPIRRVYDEATEAWWFSVVDIIRVLTQQTDATSPGNTGTSSNSACVLRAANW